MHRVLLMDGDKVVQWWDFDTEEQAKRHYRLTDPPPGLVVSRWMHHPAVHCGFGVSYQAYWAKVESKEGAEEFC